MSLGEEQPSQTLGVLQGKGDKFTKLTLIEKKRLADLEDAIDYIQAETEKYRSKAKTSAIQVMNIHVLTPKPAYQRADGVNIGKEAQMVTNKTLIVLEAKLNKLLQRKSELLNQNKKLKEQINHFRLMRLQTDLAHSKFESVLAEEKAKIESFLAESTAVVEERDRILEKVDELKAINVREKMIFQEKYEEMGRYIKDQNNALEDALLKERKADRKESSLQKMKSSDENDNSLNIISDLSLEEEVRMAKEMGNLTAFMADEQNSLSHIREKIEIHDKMFEQLKYMTGVESLEDMVSNYIAHEEEMFSLYNFIQAINTDIDTVLESTAQTEEEIHKYRVEQQDQDQQRRTTIEELQKKLESALEVTKEFEALNSIHQETVTQISKKVSSVFFKLQCDQMETKGSQVTSGKNNQRWSAGSRPESKVALITGQGVSESNVLDYLGCIEQRSVDIITEYLRIQTRIESNTSSPMFLNSKTGIMMRTRSPTPGPSTPMHWYGHSSEPLIDLNELSDDDMLNEGDNNGTNVNANNGAGEGGDSKPVDLSVYKFKLEKKLGIRESHSSSSIFRASKSGSGNR